MCINCPTQCDIEAPKTDRLSVFLAVLLHWPQKNSEKFAIRKIFKRETDVINMSSADETFSWSKREVLKKIKSCKHYHEHVKLQAGFSSYQRKLFLLIREHFLFKK